MTSSSKQDGDDERVIRWVTEHSGAVRGYLIGLVRRTDLAEDLLQEVFRRAWQARERYEEQGSPRAYLLRIADRLACDNGRRRAHREITLDEAAWCEVEPLDRGAMPGDPLIESEAKAALAVALDALSVPQRRVLLLRYYGEMSFEEVAATLACPLNTGAQPLSSRAVSTSPHHVRESTMNAETNELLRRLEQATTAAPVDRGTLDEETAMLRENWLALGRLLRAAESQLEHPKPVEVVELRRPAAAPRRSWLLALGCVGSALAVVGLWLVFQTRNSHDGTQQTANRPQSDGTRSGVLPSEAPRPTSAGAIELAWEDGWESDFAQTAMALQHFHGERRERDSSLSRLQGEVSGTRSRL